LKPLLSVLFLAWLASVCRPALAAEDNVKIKPVPPVPKQTVGKISSAYNWILKDRIRGIYGYIGNWQNKELMDNIQKAGFNTLLVHTMSTAMSEKGWPEEAAQWAKVQKERKLRIIISWPYGSDERYGNTQFGAYNTGTSEIWTKGPCPLSEEYWNKVVGDRAVIAAQTGLTGMVVDMEMYAADHTRYPGSCYCDECWGRFIRNHIGEDFLGKIDPTKRAAWTSDNGLWEDYDRWQENEVTRILKVIEKRVHAVDPGFILGNLLDPESLPGMSRGFGTSSMPALIFSELEYHGNVTGVSARVKQLRDQGYPALYVPGLWVQPVTPPQLPELIMGSAPQSAGYWIWTTAAFRDNASGDYAHAKGYSHDDYWNVFRTSNNALIDWLRSGAQVPKAPEKDVPTVTVPFISAEPATDADWSRGALMENFGEVHSGKPATAATTVRALWDGNRVYLKVVCDEPAPEKMVAPSGDRDNGNLWMQESIEVFWMRPDGDRMTHIIVNNAGTIADSLMIGMRPEAPGWNPDIKTAVSSTDKGWELVLSLPIDQDGAGKIKAGDKLRLQVGRNRPGGGETTCWAPVGGMYKAAPHLWGVLTLSADKNVAPARSKDEDSTLDNLSPRLSWIRDKGMRMGYNYRVPVEWYAKAAEVGINAIISRLEIANDPSGDELVADKSPNAPAVVDWRTVRTSSIAAKDAGVRFFYMLNPAAYEYNVNDGFRDNRRRYNNGTDFSPLDDIYWTRVVENRFLRVAKLLQGDEYQIDGFLIDPELYALGGRQPGYDGLDYGDFALAEFVKDSSAKFAFDGLTIEERKRKIAELGLNESLSEFQFNRIRQLAESTRTKVQRLVPDAILGFFLWRYENNIWHRAVAAGFSTPGAPCWVGLECTYPGSFDEGLLSHLKNVRAQAGVPLLLSPGSALPGSDGPRYMDTLNTVAAGNLYSRAINSTGGYWFWALSRIFGQPEEISVPFDNMLRIVNGELDKYYASGRTYKSSLKPHAFPVEQPGNIETLRNEVGNWVPVPASALPTDPPSAQGLALRGSDLAVAVPAETGQKLSFVVRNHRLAHYPTPTYTNVFAPDGKISELETVLVGKQAELSHSADASGVWVLGVSGGPPVVPNAFSVLPTTKSAVVVPADSVLRMFGFSNSFSTSVFFYVPKGCSTFDIQLSGAAVLRLFDPSGKAILEHSEGKTKPVVVDDEQEGAVAKGTDKDANTITVDDDQSGRVWYVTISQANWGSYSIRLGGIPAVFSARPEQLLAPKL